MKTCGTKPCGSWCASYTGTPETFGYGAPLIVDEDEDEDVDPERAGMTGGSVASGAGEISAGLWLGLR